jgi:hypothetical protein
MTWGTIDIVNLLMRFREVTLRLFRLFLLIIHLSCLEHLIYETLESITVSGFVLSLGVENGNVIQEAFKFTRHGPVLLIASRSFHRSYRTIRFPLLVVALGRAGLVRVARLLLLLLLSGVEGRLLGQSILVSDGKHFS